MAEEYTANLDADSFADVDLEADLQEEAEAAGIDPALLQAVELWAEPPSGRQRQISAKIRIPRSTEQVWQVLTDYEALSTFIPNLASSKRLPRSDGGVRLEQVGTQRLLRFNFSARVVLDLEETYPTEIGFQMVEGDFKSFSGSWRLETVNTTGKPETSLAYKVMVLPKRTMPVMLIERRLRQDLPLNLVAVRRRVETLFSV